MIRALIRGRTVRSQAELRALLAGRRFAVTQATLSRDLKALGFVRRGGRWVEPGEVRVAEARRLWRALGEVLGDA